MKAQTFLYALILLSFLVMLHQYVNWGYFWEWGDALHHEVLTIGLFAFALGGFYVLRRREG